MKLKKFFYKKINSTNDIAVKKIRKGFRRGLVFAIGTNKRQRSIWKKVDFTKRKFIFISFY